MVLPFHNYTLLGHCLGHCLSGLPSPEARVTDRGEIRKEVECEACGCEYVYQLCRAAQGRATGGDYFTAAHRARENLSHALETGCDPVPCPVCGWYQRQMVRRARQLKYRGLFQVSLVLLCLGAILFVLGMVISGCLASVRAAQPSAAFLPLAILAGAALGAALALQVLKFMLCRRYDPNAEDVESRKQLGRSQALIERVEIRLGVDGKDGVLIQERTIWYY
jgi:hypothetical protein